MSIRKANYKDAPAIKLLLNLLGYQSSVSLLVEQIEASFGINDNELYVFELQKDMIVGFISVHFYPQLAFDGNLAFISYLAVEEIGKNFSVAQALEEYVTKEARKRKCERIQVHCQDWRTNDHQLYQQQGYISYPNFYTKRLIYAE